LLLIIVSLDATPMIKKAVKLTVRHKLPPRFRTSR
jgi:hypothetical protein